MSPSPETVRKLPKIKGELVVLVYAVTAAMAAFWAFQISKGFMSASWPSVHGRITESRLEVLGTGTDESVTLRIKYQYATEVGPFEGDRLHYHLWGGDRATKQAWVDAHPAMKEVRVYYNPADHSECTLVPGLRGADYLTVLAPLALLAGCIVLHLIWRWKKDAPDQTTSPPPAV